MLVASSAMEGAIVKQILARVGLCLIVAGASSAGAGAQESTESLTTEQVRDAFQQNLYDVDEPIFWESSRLTTFFVRDGMLSERLVLVLVYPDIATAEEEHRVAHAEEEAERGTRLPFDHEHGPPLLPGYGRSAWILNVALVQASQSADPPAVTNELEPPLLVSTRAGRIRELASLEWVDLEFLLVVRSLVALNLPTG
jgi:hypothetical protein